MSTGKNIKQSGGKNIRNARGACAVKEIYAIEEAIEMLKTRSFAKFDESIDICMKLGVDPKHSDQMVRGAVPMPHSTGKKYVVAVFAKDNKAEEAKAAGADIVGSDELLEMINKGQINFNVCIATPDMMGFVGRVAKILGPKGLMPNPKLGTVTANVAEAVKIAKSGQVEFRTEKAGIVHAGVARKSLTNDKILDNIKAFVSAVVKAKPSGAKGTYLKNIFLSTTMGPALEIDLSSLSN